MKVVSLHDPHLSRLNAEVEALKVQRDRAWIDYQTASKAHTDAIFKRARYIEDRARRVQEQA